METMSRAIHSPSSRHKQAAHDHEVAAHQHRTAAEFHDKRMLHAARLSSEQAEECCMTAHGRSMLACQLSADTAVDQSALPESRALQIRRILDARFSLSTFEAFRHNDPQSWSSARNDMGRGIYGEAQRERQRLEAATESELQAELAGAARF
jgi:hypothetical protein